MSADLLEKYIKDCYQEFKNEKSGELASYIPELTKANPDHFAISVFSCDGREYSIGDSQEEFSIQSISKVLTYAFALEHCEKENLEEKIGVEPSGEGFDSITRLDSNKKPYNPMVNAGAICTADIICRHFETKAFKEVLNFFCNTAGRSLNMDINVYDSERSTGHKNLAIAHLLKNFNCVEGEVEKTLDLYFRQCSINTNAKDLARIAATLANGGIPPNSKKKTLSLDSTRCVLSIMLSSGMYDYSGSWLYHIGLPAKSGVSGGLMVVVPGKMGIGIYSPKIDKKGNSVRGIKACQYLSKALKLHMFHF